MIKRVLPTTTLVTMITLSVVFSGCVDPYYAPNTRYQSTSHRYYSPAPRYVTPTPRSVYVAPTPGYVTPHQPQTKVIIVEQPRYRDSGRMDRHHTYSNDRGGSYRNNSSRMDLQPNPLNDTYRNGSNRIENRSNPAQNGSARMNNSFNPTKPRFDNRPSIQPTPPVQPVIIQPRVDNRPTIQPQPRMDNHPRRDSNGSAFRH